MDLFSLFKFLRCSPFDELRVFNAEVTEKWKARSDPDSVAKLKTLISCLALRRPKDTIGLLPRRDDVKKLDFNDSEQENYKLVRSKTLSSIRNFNPGSQGNCNEIFSNALKWVNELRLICNHGLKSAQEVQKVDHHLSAWTAEEAQTRFDQLDGIGLAKCSSPACCQDLSSVKSSEAGAEHEEEPWIDNLLEIWCGSCFKDQNRNNLIAYKICNYLPRRLIQMPPFESKSDPHSEVNTPTLFLQVSSGIESRLPTKVKKLIHDLLETPDNIKRSAMQQCKPFEAGYANKHLQCCFLLVDKDFRHHPASALG